MAAKIITSLPPYITPEEHGTLTASTPNSFTSIPPVLRHIEQNVSVSLDPPLEDFSAEDCKDGTLYVIERCGCSYSRSLFQLTDLLPNSVLAFMSSTGRGFQIEYPSITLHAISRAESGPAIYCQLDETPPESDALPANLEDGDSPMRELNITPQNQASRTYVFSRSCLSLRSSHPNKQKTDISRR
jgi:chloride channel, nucleotide-sensitive, 1A